ncbi:hypothetical protein [Flavobacterium sp.]|uniref:hypothetical protein n=1 Tax=Flavobacteriaceae TaxID=49546 RepID=UPI0040484C41
MKHIFLAISFFFLFSATQAQNKITITLKDSTVLNGFGRIKVDETILFKKTEDSEKEIYDYTTVKKLIIHSDESDQEYEYKIVEGSGGVGSVKLIEILKTGKINLYQDYASGMSYGPNMTGGYGFTSYSKTTYYISENGSDTVTNLRIGNTYSKRFKKIAKKYFNDCPDLLEKINSKFFKRYGIHSVVKYYNEKCE